jgi:hypothetical protein
MIGQQWPKIIHGHTALQCRLGPGLTAQGADSISGAGINRSV